MKMPVPVHEIPDAFQERYAEMLEILEDFCTTHLNDEYLDSCYRLAADLCQDGSPILSGKAKSWAAGLIWAIGRVNFLSDPSFQPCLTQKQFAAAIGVSPATISAKCGEIWDGLELMPMDADYTVASRLQDNPLIWMVEINGFILDLRTAPRDVQQAAFDQGLIPFIPKDGPADSPTDDA